MSSELIIVGRIVRVHGTNGELHIRLDNPESVDLKPLQTIHIGNDSESAAVCTIVSIREIANGILLSLAGHTTSETVTDFAGAALWMSPDSLKPLAEDTYYHYQLTGLKVRTTDGRIIGELTDIMQTGANDVYIVTAPGREYLIPAIASVVRAVDLESGWMTIEDMQNMLE